MQNNFRDWEIISNDPNGLEVTEQQLMAISNTVNNEWQQEQKVAEAEEERMLLGEEEASVGSETMDAQMEEQLLGSTAAVETDKKTNLMVNSNNEKSCDGGVKNGRTKAKKSLFGAKCEENLRQFQFNVFGAPSVGPIQFGGGMDLSLISSKSDTSITNEATLDNNGKTAKVKKTVSIKKGVSSNRRTSLKRKIVQNSPTKKLTTNLKKMTAQRIAVGAKKRRSKSLDIVLRSKWDTSSSLLGITSSDRSSIFEEKIQPKGKRDKDSDGRTCTTSTNTKDTQTSTKFSFFSSTGQMLAERAQTNRNGRELDGENEPDSEHGFDEFDGKESADEQSEDAEGDEYDGGTEDGNFLGLFDQKESIPKSRLKSDTQRDNSQRMSRTNTTNSSESSSKFYEGTSPYTDFSPKTTLFVCPVPQTLNETGLKRYFLRFGEIRTVIVPSNSAIGEHRGFGFVDFYSERSAKAAYAERGKIWPRDGVKPFNLSWYRSKQQFSPPVPDNKIYVFQLSEKCTETALFDYFNRYGRIEQVRIGRTANGDRAATIYFANWHGASRAIAVNPKHCEWPMVSTAIGESSASNGSVPMRKWDKIFDLSKSNSTPKMDAQRLCLSTRPSNDAPATIHKQFFPDIQRTNTRRRSLSVGRFLSNGSTSYNYPPDQEPFTDRDEIYLSSPMNNIEQMPFSHNRSNSRVKPMIGIKRRFLSTSSSEEDLAKQASPREGRTPRRSSDEQRKVKATSPAPQARRGRSQRPKRGRNSAGGDAAPPTPLSPSLPSSSTSSLALEMSSASQSSDENRRQKENISHSSDLTARDKHVLFTEFLEFLEWKEKSKKVA